MGGSSDSSLGAGNGCWVEGAWAGSWVLVDSEWQQLGVLRGKN